MPLKTAIDGNRQAWLEDPDGNRIELMEMAPDCLQYKAITRLRGRGGAGLMPWPHWVPPGDAAAAHSDPVTSAGCLTQPRETA